MAFLCLWPSCGSLVGVKARVLSMAPKALHNLSLPSLQSHLLLLTLTHCFLPLHTCLLPFLTHTGHIHVSGPLHWLLSAWYALPLVLSVASSSSLQVCAQISPYQWDFPCAFHYILEIVPATFICIHSFPCFLCLKSIYHPLTYLIFSLLGFNNFAFLPLELQLCKQVCLSLLFNSVCLKPGTRPSTQ